MAANDPDAGNRDWAQSQLNEGRYHVDTNNPGVYLNSAEASEALTGDCVATGDEAWLIPIGGIEVKAETTLAKLIFGSSTKSATKLANQMAQRGWEEELVKQTVNSPFTTRVSTNLATGNSATAYYAVDGAYVVVDDITNEVVQVSGRNTKWLPDSNIIDPYIP